MSASAIPDLKRIQFFTGQRLSAQDMTDVQIANREMRWLHNRSLHGWGIGIGYGVTGESGDTQVTIDPGYAIDCLGRELVLTNQVTMTVPAVAGNQNGTAVTPATFYLTVSYLDDGGQSTVESRPGVCLPAGTVRLTEAPLIQWQQLKDIQNGVNVILAEASILNCQLNSPLDLGVRRSARPSQQPYISSGQLTPDSITWGILPGAIGAHVDTSPAQFSATPAYFMHVMGPRLVTLKDLGDVGSDYFLIPVPVISQAGPAGFDCVLTLLTLDSVKGVVALPQDHIQPAVNVINWTIVWMGVEG